MFSFKAYIISVVVSIAIAIALMTAVIITMVLAVAAIDDTADIEGQSIMEGDGEPISEDVERYEDEFKKQAKENDIKDQVDVLMALTMQESSGTEQDIMQSSESQGDSPGTISNPKESIKVGVEYYADLYEEADGDEELTLQAYNMGGGFIDYAEKHNDGKYSKDLAEEFSNKQKEKNGSDVYGDPHYVDHVKQYMDAEKGDKKDFKGGEWAAPLEIDLQQTSGYGKRESPGGIGSTDHRGIDFDCTNSDDIVSVHDGEVFKTGSDSGGWGNYVVVRNSEDEFSLYGHMSEIETKKGKTVKQGDTVGVCGQTGGTTGEHLHLEYWDSDKAMSDKEHRKDPNKMLKD